MLFVSRCRAVVLSGSLPAGVPSDFYAQLITIAHAANVPAYLDASGAALRQSIESKPDLIKPNKQEFADFVGGSLASFERYSAAAVVSAIPVEAAHVMQPADGSTPAIFAEFSSLLPGQELQRVERFAFYDLGRRSEVGLVIATGEARIYANLMLTIGVVKSSPTKR